MKRRFQVIIVAALAALMSSAVHARPGRLANEVTENTRAAIWDAMHRKETYATTGPREHPGTRLHLANLVYPLVARFGL
jgi:hypothetical protein